VLSALTDTGRTAGPGRLDEVVLASPRYRDSQPGGEAERVAVGGNPRVDPLEPIRAPRSDGHSAVEPARQVGPDLGDPSLLVRDVPASTPSC